MFSQRKTSRSTIQPPSIVSVIKDPAGRTIPLQPSWCIVSRVEVGRWMGTKAATCSPSILREGDFVDIGISFDIFVLPLRCKQHTHPKKCVIWTHLNIDHILQLCTTDDASEVSCPHLHYYLPANSHKVCPSTCSPTNWNSRAFHCIWQNISHLCMKLLHHKHLPFCLWFSVYHYSFVLLPLTCTKPVWCMDHEYLYTLDPRFEISPLSRGPNHSIM